LKITLITISYNSESTFQKTLESVQAQTYSKFEHILVDGGSTDATLTIAITFPHISKIISEPDKGIYDALNKGLQNATGDIIGFLNSDDIFYDENSLEIIAAAFDENTDCVFGDLVYTNDQNQMKRKWKGSPFIRGTFKKGWMPAHPTFYCRRSIYEKFGLYNDSYKIAGDFELMLRFFEKHQIKSKYIPQTLVNMKVGGVSNKSLQSKYTILDEEFRAFRENGLKVNKLQYLYYKLKKIGEFTL
jgi:glycosyltransferase involved in cell wall biosynthesis